MQSLNINTSFNISKQPINTLYSFVGKGFSSPYLEDRRKVINIVDKPVVKEEVKKTIKFSDIEDSQDDNPIDLRTVSEDRLNDSLEELSTEDYEDFGEIGIEILDYVLDRVFIFMNREPAKIDSLAKKKKERLKIIAGRLFQKWGVKFSLEMLGGFLLVGYIHMRFKQSTKQGEEKVKSKDTKGIIPLNSFEKRVDKEINPSSNLKVKKTSLM